MTEEKTNPFAWSRGPKPKPFYEEMADMQAEIERLRRENAMLKNIVKHGE